MECFSEIIRPGRPPAAVVDLHHQVLLPWCRLRRRIGRLLPVLSLDHHTDVLPAFSCRLRRELGLSAASAAAASRRLVAGTAMTEEGIAAALARLRHDEHFDFALKRGIVSRVSLISQVNFARRYDRRIRISCEPVIGAETVLANTPPLRAFYDRILEDEFLNAHLARLRWRAAAGEYILDIDLDVFKTVRALHPERDCRFRRLVSEAALVTISRERDWCRLLALDAAAGDSGKVLQILFERYF